MLNDNDILWFKVVMLNSNIFMIDVEDDIKWRHFVDEISNADINTISTGTGIMIMKHAISHIVSITRKQMDDEVKEADRWAKEDRLKLIKS